MIVTVEDDDSVKTYLTSKPVTVQTIAGAKVVVGIFNDEVQVINITGDSKSTMVSFNGKNLP